MNKSDQSFEELRLALKAKRGEEAEKREVMRGKLKGIYIPMSLIREVGLDAAFLYCYVLNRLPEGSERTVSLRIEDVEKGDRIERVLPKETTEKAFR